MRTYQTTLYQVVLQLGPNRRNENYCTVFFCEVAVTGRIIPPYLLNVGESSPKRLLGRGDVEYV